MDSNSQSIGAGWPTAEELIEFIDGLKHARYQIGVSQYVAAQDLVLALMVRGEKPEKLGLMLEPLLCSTPAEQEEFQQRYTQWSKRLGLPFSELEGDAQSADARQFERELRQVKRQRRWLPGLLGLVFAILLSLLLFLFARQFWPDPVNPNPSPSPPALTDSPTELPAGPVLECPSDVGQIAPTLPDQRTAFPVIRKPILESVLLIPLPIYLGVVVFWMWQAKLLLRRRPSDREPNLERISLDGIVRDLFPPVTFLRIAQGMRRRFKVPTTDPSQSPH